jgi:hemin uptake protein HemP
MNATSGEDDRDDPQALPPHIGARREISVAANRVESRDLFVGTREITIAHAGDIYRLRLTAQNKLILTK